MSFLRRTCVIVWIGLAAACGSATHPGDGASDVDASGSDGTVSDGAMDGLPTDSVTPDALGDSSSGEVGPDAPPTECSAPSDCLPLHGAAPCGAWECNGGACQVVCAGCTDADHDGYGTGAAGACAGLDCNDSDPAVHASASRTCYSGPAGTSGVGVCRPGTEVCIGGAWGGCSGEVRPSGEACNNQDDDCNGMVDDGLGSFTCGIGACAATVPACTAGVTGTCIAGTPAANDATCDGIDNDCDGAIDENCTCVHVASTGNDANAASTMNATPFLTIQAAINWAAGSTTRPHIVCVASGATCAANYTYPAAAIVMSNGISVYGRYESTTWTRCTSGTPTGIVMPGARGVEFPNTVTTATVLDGFRIDRATAATTSAVTVDGARNVILSNLTISNTPTVTNSYGINLVNNAQATVTASSIYAGTGTGESIGVRSDHSQLTITNNCLALDANGRCDDFCGATNPAIRGRFTTGTGVTYAVLLQDSPNSLIETSALCGNDADQGAGLRIAGNGTGIVVRGNLINAWGGAADSHGIWLEDCGGAAPWIVSNFQIAAAGDTVTSRADGIHAIGDCHPVIDSNVLITGGSEGGTSGANGVYCGANVAGLASRCVVLGNTRIQGSQGGWPPTSVGVRCDDGGCLRIANNTITGRAGVDTWGLWMGSTGTLVDNNDISGGCPVMSATGVFARDSYARFQNNRISAGGCNTGGTATTRFAGLRVVSSAGAHEVDVHSNDIDGGGLNLACTSAGIDMDVSATPPSTGLGVYRNNVVRAGACGTRHVVREVATAADPRIFENNDLDPFNTPMSIYLDENATALTTIAAVNALTDATVRANLSADAMFVSYPTNLHLQAGSPCINAGTPTGAPATDMDGVMRDSMPDIGADEH